jgi:hypothetical protein
VNFCPYSFQFSLLIKLTLMLKELADSSFSSTRKCTIFTERNKVNITDDLRKERKKKYLLQRSLQIQMTEKNFDLNCRHVFTNRQRRMSCGLRTGTSRFMHISAGSACRRLGLLENITIKFFGKVYCNILDFHSWIYFTILNKFKLTSRS